jgi:fructose-bisphosphate aldolase class II
VHREFFATSPELFDPVLPGKKYMEAYQNFMCKRFDILGASGKSLEIKL